MKIAMIHWGYPPIIGGVETHLSQLCPALVELGHEVFLLTGSHPEAASSYIEHGVKIKRLPIMDLNWLYHRGFASLENDINREIEVFLDETKAEIIHAHNMHYFSKIHAKALEQEALKRNIPLVLTAHNVWDDSEFLLLSNIKWDHIIAVSQFIKKELAGFGFNPDKITSILHGVRGNNLNLSNKESAWQKYPVLKNRKVIFHPARMGLAKGSAVIVKAFRLIKNEFPDALLVLAGTKNIIDWGEYQQKEIAYIVQLLDVLGLRKDTLIDQYPVDFMPAMYVAADICVYPSIFSEPFGLVMLESMSTGKPVVVSRSGGMPEVIKSGINGYIVPPNDYISLARAIAKLFKDPKLASRLGQNGLKIFHQKFTLERMVDDIIIIYNNTLDLKRQTKIYGSDS
ncbi:MAG: hypothetical protein A3J07_03855 [Candidatus Doudnabacteria bacterium RIFCSPLOWO2_02_FULL_49_13]|uniref:Glycosyl transferase family 1 n=1 Tax=Candidatus Doudnabacteria bacterium RIFCSPHIGHO2_12_FULL_48_16 TaxID=1817838 RepID=A0A1F5PJI9_9BACT|nr:MAG: hypothetical protein A3B77_02665 [Candidatus Doudnabacteria bacterium RIFCSPHIGHO2_02_FULL_49_24]OGE89608.1 MAG: hypothetical protein A2760_03870 [Candidatus Doudnabacteria bacterium RIFCSPHIGHO2_01_FULL_50_67]OGE90051.1 MAG: hypothetical protein A3E29_03000 [Candidatus Doudnabacteria bacterium RIFCSPHIGHO2_12_FULL_48_16]OGE96624.1 MAG: hypothetical protein A2990_00310 [Candidatus Doudnabacteria bacterium RIFCSPLOWO2_01_FULL_49_40]OGF03194.1 MAG: hypothetical protein A3J07_03855 [Candid